MSIDLCKIITPTYRVLFFEHENYLIHILNDTKRHQHENNTGRF